MIIVKLKGGLGNQMFEYAYGRNLSLLKKDNLLLDISSLENTSSIDTKRKFGLDVFNINAKIVNIKKNKVVELYEKIKRIITGNNGFYQNENYFKKNEETIRKEFTLKQPLSRVAHQKEEEIIQCENSVSIHVRRGDYVSNQHARSHHGLLDIDYYNKAIDYINKKILNPKFFIVSDDVDWVKNNLKLENVSYISCPEIKDYEEIILMSRCKNQIIANSSFSWWGAWLNSNKNKIVIAPKQWTVKKTANELNILPKSWIQI